MENDNVILERLGQGEVLVQLAEEAAELGHAALKLRRAVEKKNPTPISAQEAYENLLEEIADVSNALRTLGLDCGMVRMRIYQIMSQKQERWAQRLEIVPDSGTAMEVLG